MFYKIESIDEFLNAVNIKSFDDIENLLFSPTMLEYFIKQYISHKDSELCLNWASIEQRIDLTDECAVYKDYSGIFYLEIKKNKSIKQNSLF